MTATAKTDVPPPISVIVPVCNAAEWIGPCLNALLRLDYDQDLYEIILVDNNSQDASRELIRRHSGVRLLEEPVQSSYAARNRGVREARGEILAFTDADCVPDPGWLRSIASAFADPCTQALLGSRAPGSDSNTARLLAAYDDARVRYILENRLARHYFGFTNNMAVRRTAFERYGPFEAVERGADTVWLRRLARGEGAEAVRWAGQMRIRHLEFSGSWVYLRKNFIYARARQKTKAADPCIGLSPGESFRLLRNVTQESSMWAQFHLGAVLATGRLSWIAGTLL